MNMIKKSLLIASTICCFSMQTKALEVTYYSVASAGVTHHVTVALDSLDDDELVRCIILNGTKPVGMEVEAIEGVGTIQIEIPGGILEKTSAKCEITTN